MVAKAKTKELVVQNTDNEALPAYLANVKSVGTDNFDASDVSIPMVKLLQGLSEECKNFSSAQSGHFWHTGADMSMGPDFRFVIASRRKKYLLIAPIEDGQGVLARSDDAVTWDRTGSWEIKIDKKTKVTWSIDNLDVVKSGLTEWGTSDPSDENSTPAATLVYEYLILLPDHLELGPAVMSLARSGIKKAKKGLNDKIQLHRNNGRPIQSLVFLAKSNEEQSPSGSYNNWSFTSGGFAPEPVYRQAVDISNMLTSYSVKGEESVNEDAGQKSDSDAF